MTDTLRAREIELINYLRTNMTDPNGRGTARTDNFVATAGQTTFTLTQTGVKNIVSVVVNSVPQNIGYNYTANFGEGSAVSTVVLRVGALVGQPVVITYRYGTCMIYEGFQRLDSELPRISVIPQPITPEFVAIGEAGDSGSGSWIYYNASYIMELRTRFASQLKQYLMEAANLINLYRQSTPQPYKTVIATIDFISPEDFDNDLRLYHGQIKFTVKWLIKFKD